MTRMLLTLVLAVVVLGLSLIRARREIKDLRHLLNADRLRGAVRR